MSSMGPAVLSKIKVMLVEINITPLLGSAFLKHLLSEGIKYFQQ